MEENTEVTLDPEINPEMVERILADIFSVSVNIVGDHLTDDEFADYVIEAVPEHVRAMQRRDDSAA